MTGCCRPRGYERMFNPRFARRRANRYRRRGLDRTARRMVALLPRQDVAGASVLEIGGGVGEIQLELLERGAARATNLELSAAYETEARQLLRAAGLEHRAQRRLVDIALDGASVEPADVVVLHRVVCCYPDHATLLAAAAEHARRAVVFSFPPRNLLSRALVATQNRIFRLRGSEFRVFVHPPRELLAVLAAHGMHPVTVGRSGLWKVALVTR
jgi:2-polyprenyl-3-methyl-5-hydroxy-6-metoxy-1,4-benzoquinol methylase